MKKHLLQIRLFLAFSLILLASFGLWVVSQEPAQYVAATGTPDLTPVEIQAQEGNTISAEQAIELIAAQPEVQVFLENPLAELREINDLTNATYWIVQLWIVEEEAPRGWYIVDKRTGVLGDRDLDLI